MVRRSGAPRRPPDFILDASRIDFVGIDVQGWEYQVFLGMERIVRESLGLRIFFEHWRLGLRNAGCQPADCLSYLRSLGFSLFQVLALGLTPITDFEEFTCRLRRHYCVKLVAVRET
jgi:Methyltransferase FkbM domain